MTQSEGELVFSAHLKHANIKYVAEYQFYEKRKWRADFALLEHKILIEIEGGVYSGGRHTRGSGFEKDCEKYNMATALGWKVFRFTTKKVMSNEAIEFIEGFLNGNANC
ncbi:MAG: hypothetical protein DRP02_02200 [Candidatus Gerdarchaeota archaeon]|nr:MAG: hypothetical protein DRP02_02200 [Candidatus Gerdarchaeota archaeon]